MTCICFTKIGHHWYNNGLSPVRQAAIIYNHAGILLIGSRRKKDPPKFIQNTTISVLNSQFEMSSANLCPFYLDLNVFKSARYTQARVYRMHARAFMSTTIQSSCNLTNTNISIWNETYIISEKACRKDGHVCSKFILKFISMPTCTHYSKFYIIVTVSSWRLSWFCLLQKSSDVHIIQ